MSVGVWGCVGCMSECRGAAVCMCVSGCVIGYLCVCMCLHLGV